MKKFNIYAAIVAASLSLSSCGLGSTSSLLSTAGSVASAYAGTSSTSSTVSTVASALTSGNTLTSVLTSLLGSSNTTESNIVGTWTYSAPKVVFESENVLAKLGGTAVSSKVESSLGTQLTKLGFSAGKSTLVLNSDKTCTLTLSGKTASGTYTFDSSSNKMTITGALGVGTISCTATVSNGQLIMLFDADKILTLANSMSSKTSSSLSSLLQNYSGLKLGWAMSK